MFFPSPFPHPKYQCTPGRLRSVSLPLPQRKSLQRKIENNVQSCPPVVGREKAQTCHASSAAVQCLPQAAPSPSCNSAIKGTQWPAAVCPAHPPPPSRQGRQWQARQGSSSWGQEGRHGMQVGVQAGSACRQVRWW